MLSPTVIAWSVAIAAFVVVVIAVAFLVERRAKRWRERVRGRWVTYTPDRPDPAVRAASDAWRARQLARKDRR